MSKITFSKTNDILVDGKRTGMYVREGSFRGTTDDRLGRWYIGDSSDDFFRPFGAGHRTRMEAAEMAIEALAAAAGSFEDINYVAANAGQPSMQRY